MTGRQIIFSLISAIVILCAGIFWFAQRGADDEKADAAVSVRGSDERQEPPGGEVLRFSVSTMWSVESTFTRYRKLVERIANNVGMPGAFILRSSYGELRRTITAGDVDAAFVCTGPYVGIIGSNSVELLARPEFVEGVTYRSILLVPASSAASDIGDLAGVTLAFADRESFSGCVIPTLAMVERGIFPPEFFGEILFTGNHELSIRAVDRGLADAAFVHSVVWKSACDHDPELAVRLKEIWTSPDYGVPPVIVRKGLDSQLRERLEAAFLDLHNDEEGRQILSELNIVRFRTPVQGEYDSALEVYEKLRANKRIMSWLSGDGL